LVPLAVGCGLDLDVALVGTGMFPVLGDAGWLEPVGWVA
jgi:hypothetical protein